MRIAIDLTALADNFSGIERYAANITMGLTDIDKDDTLMLFFKDSVHELFKGISNRSSLEIHVVPSRGFGKLIFSQILLPFALSKAHPDLTLFFAFPAPLVYRGKSISTIHDLTCWDCPQTMTLKSRMLWRQLDKKAARSPYGVITISEFSKARILEHYKINSDSVIVAYCGIDEAQFNVTQARKVSRDVLVEKYQLPREYILSLSTIEPRKNLSALLKAWGELRVQGLIDCDLVLAGRRGWKTEKLIECCPEDARRNVFFTGFVDDEDLPALYASAELFVFPSLYEGFGLPPVEAICSGARVLCSDIPCLREVCGDAVSYFSLTSPEELKDALRKTLDGDSHTRSLSRNLPREYRWNSEAQKVAENVQKVFRI